MLQKELLGYALLAVIGAVLLAHVFFPRYDWRPVESSGSISIVVFDRWTGRFQRAVYDDTGGLNVMGVFIPF